MIILPCQYMIATNIAPNLFSIYDPASTLPVFQIDANLGYPAAVLVREPSCASIVILICSTERPHPSTRFLQSVASSGDNVTPSIAQEMAFWQRQGRAGQRGDIH
jgi:hypothetical protein